MILAVVVGCNSANDSSSNSSTTKNSDTKFVGTHSSFKTPRELLDRVLTRYRQCRSYTDQATVQLFYTEAGNPVQDVAPIAVAYEAPNRLALKAYMLQACPEKDRWMATVRVGEVRPLANQYLVRKIPDQIELDWFYDDPLLSRFLTGGLAGLPPQLDFIFSPEPMAPLLHPSATLRLEDKLAIDGVECYRISINLGSAKYMIWIDTEKEIIRRLEMPVESLPSEMLSSREISNIRWTIEFAGALFDKTPNWDQWRISLPDEPFAVRRFVLPPPPTLSNHVGKVLPSFTLESPAGESVYQSNTQEKITMLVWLANHSGSKQLAREIAQLHASLVSQGMQQELGVVPIWAEPNPPAESSFETLASDWKLPGELAIDRKAIGRDVFAIAETPAVVLLGKDGRVQHVQYRASSQTEGLLSHSVSRLVAGEDLAEQLEKELAIDQARYRSELRIAAAAQSPYDTIQDPGPYPPRAFSLESLWKTECDAPLVAITKGDWSQGIAAWSIDRSGNLTAWDCDGKASTKVSKSSLRMSEGNHWLLRASTSGPQRVAVASKEHSQLAIYDLTNSQWRLIPLEAEQRIIDITWVEDQRQKDLWLTLLTSTGKVIMIDPNSGKSLSGQSPQTPLAVLPALIDNATSTNNNDSGWRVILSNGSIEPLLLPGASTLAKQTSFSEKSTATPTSPQPKQDRLSFSPSAGPWAWGIDQGRSYVLATGTSEPDDPVAILLDQNLRPIWQYPLSVQRQAYCGASLSSQADPQTGTLYWTVLSPESTIHLVRVDGVINDHYSPGASLIGSQLTSDGQDLILVSATGTHIEAQRIIVPAAYRSLGKETAASQQIQRKSTTGP